jgi:biopolymer transport protein ExbD
MAASSSVYSGEADETLITDINVTPLVDVVLVLLIVLMITMPAIISMDILNERELNVALPEAIAAKPLISKPQELIVNVDREGKYTVHQTAQTAQDLFQLFEQANTDNPGRASVIIRADKFCHWQAVVTVMDLCNKAQIHDYRVSTMK